MTIPDVSIIIPIYNRTDALQETLRALGRQTYPPEGVELIVVDDGSTDGSPEVVSEVGTLLPFPVSLLQQEQLGPAAARNHGAEQSRGDLLLFCDSDLIADPHNVEVHVDLHARQDAILVAGARYPWEPACTSTFARVCYLDEGAARRPPFGARTFQEVASFNLSIKRKDFDALGGFDPKLRAYEDVDLAYRAKQQGMRLVFSEEAFGYHNHPMTLPESGRQLRFYQAQAVAFLNKHPELDGTIEHLRDKMPIDWHADPPALVAHKIARQVLAQSAVTWMMEQAVNLLEKRYPHPTLLRFLYHKILGSHIWLGFRHGVEQFGLPGRAR